MSTPCDKLQNIFKTINTTLALVVSVLMILTGHHCSTDKHCDSARIDTLLIGNDQGHLIEAFFLIGSAAILPILPVFFRMQWIQG
jgi:hypothetical protein